MPRTKTGLTTAEFAVLGLLQSRAAYGYELQRHFGGEGTLARVCPVEPGMVYAILKSLSGLELIDGEWDSAQYPPRAVYVATPEGQAMLPQLLRAHLSMGGWVSDHAVVDRDLGTSHVFTCVEIDAMPPARTRTLSALASKG